MYLGYGVFVVFGRVGRGGSEERAWARVIGLMMS